MSNETGPALDPYELAYAVTSDDSTTPLESHRAREYCAILGRELLQCDAAMRALIAWQAVAAKTRNPDATCETCVYWQIIPGSYKDYNGGCRREGAELGTGTFSDDWCGHHPAFFLAPPVDMKEATT